MLTPGCIFMILIVVYLVSPALVLSGKSNQFAITRGGSNKLQDMFTIPNILCRKYPCSTFGGTPLTQRQQCNCTCPHSKATFGYYSGRWNCTENRLVRLSHGCEFRFFAVDDTGSSQPLPLLGDFPSTVTLYLYILPPFWKWSCTIDGSKSLYRRCDGGWKPLTGNGIQSRYRLSQDISGWFQLSVLADVFEIYRHLNGRIVKLWIQCKASRTATRESCVLFKMKGTVNCDSSATSPLSTVSTTSLPSSSSASFSTRPSTKKSTAKTVRVPTTTTTSLATVRTTRRKTTTGATTKTATTTEATTKTTTAITTTTITEAESTTIKKTPRNPSTVTALTATETKTSLPSVQITDEDKSSPSSEALGTRPTTLFSSTSTGWKIFSTTTVSAVAPAVQHDTGPGSTITVYVVSGVTGALVFAALLIGAAFLNKKRTKSILDVRQGLKETRTKIKNNIPMSPTYDEARYLTPVDAKLNGKRANQRNVITNTRRSVASPQAVQGGLNIGYAHDVTSDCDEESPFYDVLENFDLQTLPPVYVTLEKPELANSIAQQKRNPTVHSPQHNIYETCSPTENFHSTRNSRTVPAQVNCRQDAKESLSETIAAEPHCFTSIYAPLDVPAVYQTLNIPKRSKGCSTKEEPDKLPPVQQDRDLSGPPDSSNGHYQPLFASPEAIYYRLDKKPQNNNSS